MGIDPQQANALMFLGVLAIIVAGVLTVAMKRSRTIGERMVELARQWGWQDAQRLRFVVAGARGSWNGYSVMIRRVPRQKRIPERMIVRVGAQVPARLAVTRRGEGFRGGRPIALFGPPLVELRDGAGEAFWIRADEITLAERLFAAGGIGLLLEHNLHGRFDGVSLGRDSLQVVRAVDSGRIGGASLDSMATIVRDEWELARAIVEALALRP